MSRSSYILALTLFIFALLAASISFMPSRFQPGLPSSASLWRSISLFLLLAGLGAALIGILSHLFEQVDRRGRKPRRKRGGKL
jgi:hypothetical protein